MRDVIVVDGAALKLAAAADCFVAALCVYVSKKILPKEKSVNYSASICNFLLELASFIHHGFMLQIR